MSQQELNKKTNNEEQTEECPDLGTEIVGEPKEFPLKPRLHPGLYPCRVVEFKKIPAKNYGGDLLGRAVLRIEIEGAKLFGGKNPDDRIILGYVVYTHKKLSDGSWEHMLREGTKMYKAFQKFGFSPKPGDKFNPEDVVGATAQALVEDSDNQAEDSKGNNYSYSVISKFLPAPGVEATEEDMSN